MNLFWVLFAGYCLIYAAYYDVKKMAFIGLGMVIIRFTYLLVALFGFISGELEFVYLLIGISDGFMALVILIPILLTDGTSLAQLWQYTK